MSREENSEFKAFSEYLTKRDKKDEEDLLAEVDKSGYVGFKIPHTGHPDCIRYLLASYRLCSRLVLIEREPFVLIRRVAKEE